MSKYAELLGLLKEDIEQIVEKKVEERMATRMHELIEVMMPSVLEHVANNLDFYQSPLDGGVYAPYLTKTQLVMKTGEGTVQYISRPFTCIEPSHYATKKYNDSNLMDYLDSRISLLESRTNESKH